MSFIGNAAENIDQIVEQPKNKPNGKVKNKQYHRAINSFNLKYFQDSLADKCSDLVQFQQEVVEQIEALINKMSKKEMEE